jgi:hypothetical protein
VAVDTRGEADRRALLRGVHLLPDCQCVRLPAHRPPDLPQGANRGRQVLLSSLLLPLPGNARARNHITLDVFLKPMPCSQFLNWKQ